MPGKKSYDGFTLLKKKTAPLLTSFMTLSMLVHLFYHLSSGIDKTLH